MRRGKRHERNARSRRRTPRSRRGPWDQIVAQRAPARWSGRGSCDWRQSLFLRGRDQMRGVAVLVIEQVRVDRRDERGIVELEREVVAGPLRSASTTRLRSRRGPHRPGGWERSRWRDWSSAMMADALGPHAQGDDLALEVAADLLEKNRCSPCHSPRCSRGPRPPRPRWRS